MRSLRTVVSLPLLLMSLHHPEASAQQLPFPTFPNLGAYSNTLKNICGKGEVSWDQRTLPTIGCFGLPSGSSANGIISGRQVEVSVNADGKAICKIDGVAADDCSGCIENDCSTTIHRLWDAPDKSVFFYFARRIFAASICEV